MRESKTCREREKREERQIQVESDRRWQKKRKSERVKSEIEAEEVNEE